MRLRIAVGLVLLGAGVSVAGDDVLRLPLGDPALREHRVELVLDGITDSRTGELLAPADLPRRLQDVRILLVGEQHVDLEFHRIQLRVIEELHAAGRHVSIGLEMFPYTLQQPLDQWSQGLLTERGLLELADWYENWGYDFKYYRDIFLFAREHGLALHALNTPRDVVRAVRERGLANLTPEQAAHVPPRVDTESDEHLRLFRALFEQDAKDDFHASLPDDQLRAMFASQCTWDATMGFHAVQAATSQGDDAQAILVVLAGTGHVAYGLGIERQIRQWYDKPVASLVPVPVGEACDPVREVQASYADFVWGVPSSSEPFYPWLGLSTTKSDAGRKVIDVASGSPAERAGFAAGDVLLTVDGAAIPDDRTLKRLLAERHWGDRSQFVVSRGGERVELPVGFRRERPEPCEKEAGTSPSAP